MLAYPVTIEAAGSLEVPIRFQPGSFGPKAGVITVASDDPAGPRTIAVAGTAPSGKLAVTGSAYFGGVMACCRAERTLSICNVGDCNLHVTSVAFKRRNRHWKLINNPFPATLHPGSCLGCRHPLQGDRKMSALLRVGHHQRRSGNAGQVSGRHSRHDLGQMRVQAVLRGLPEGLLQQAAFALLLRAARRRLLRRR